SGTSIRLSEPSPPPSPYPLQPPLQGLDGALLGLRALGVASRSEPWLGRHMADDRSCRRPLGPLAAADHAVVAKLNESAVPTLLARANHSRRLGVPRPALVDLRMDVARQRPGALNGPSVGDRLLTDDLGALKQIGRASCRERVEDSGAVV